VSEDRTAEILRYISAMAQDFGHHRQEMMHFRQEMLHFRQEMTGFKQDMTEFRQEFNEFREETNARLERVDKRLDGLEDQFKVFKVEQRQAERHLLFILEAGVTTKEKVDDLQNRVTSLEVKQS
jgi:predicted  nucleic acid-binding Zn-ribbon protein